MYKYLFVLLTAAAPISELRGAIPLAIIRYGFSPILALIFSVIGNMLPIVILSKYLEVISDFLSSKFVFFDRFFKWLFAYTRLKHSKKFEIWGAIALVSFVAIPLPLTGAYSGIVAAFLFGVPPKKAFIYIFLGVLFAGIIVTLSTIGFLTFIHF